MQKWKKIVMKEPCLVKYGLGTACWESLIVITENGFENLSKAGDKNW